jgi:hypothetical protein
MAILAASSSSGSDVVAFDLEDRYGLAHEVKGPEARGGSELAMAPGYLLAYAAQAKLLYAPETLEIRMLMMSNINSCGMVIKPCTGSLNILRLLSAMVRKVSTLSSLLVTQMLVTG